MKKSVWLLLAVAATAFVPAIVSAQRPEYPVTLAAPGKGPYTFPEGYQTPWDRIEIMVTEKMSPNLFVLHGSAGLDPAHPDASGGRAMALFGPDGVLMVDTENRQVADKTLKAIRSFTDAPIKALVNTHIRSFRRKICAMRCCIRRCAPTASPAPRPIWPAFLQSCMTTTPPRRASPR